MMLPIVFWKIFCSSEMEGSQDLLFMLAKKQLGMKKHTSTHHTEIINLKELKGEWLIPSRKMNAVLLRCALCLFDLSFWHTC